MRRIAVVGVPGAWSSETLADSVEKRTGFRLLIDLADAHFDSTRNTILYKDYDLSELDALIVKKVSSQYSPDRIDRLELLNFLAAGGTRVFSHPSSILASYSRVSCTLRLLRGGIPMPATVLTESVDYAVDAVKRFGRAILKPLYSTKARGMVPVTGDDPDLHERVADYKEAGNKIIYTQKMVNIPGRDLGVVFLGGKYIATYARVSGGTSWNTTTRDGGRYEVHHPDDRVIEIAYKAQSLFDLDFTSVDVVETDEGPLVFEVSAFGGFRGLTEATGIDVTDLYVQYVLEKLNHA